MSECMQSAEYVACTTLCTRHFTGPKDALVIKTDKDLTLTKLLF